MFSFQVYPGNMLNTYHWRAIDANHVVVWRGWYSLDGAESDTVRQRQDRERRLKRISAGGVSPARLSSRGYRPGACD